MVSKQDLIITHKVLTEYLNKVRAENNEVNKETNRTLFDQNFIYIHNLEKFQVVLNKALSQKIHE